MGKIDQAGAIFDEGYVCSQAILVVFGADFGLDKNTALKIASGFGGGMGRAGQTCGAVTGALMVLGLAMGHVSANDKTGKMNTYAAVNRFIRQFKQIHGTINCTELLGHDLGNPEAYQKAMKSGLIKAWCPVYVESAARILEQVFGP